MNNKNSINIYKTNNMFYNVYDVGAYIFNILFGYKILDNNKLGFPSSLYNKVINVLEDNHVNKYNLNYLILDNLDIIKIKEYDNNLYYEYLIKSIFMRLIIR